MRRFCWSSSPTLLPDCVILSTQSLAEEVAGGSQCVQIRVCLGVKLHVYLKKSCWPRSRSWWSVCRLFCAALDCQGGDSGQITAGEVGGEGEMKYLSGSCSLFKNRKLVLKFQVLFVFKFSALRKAGKTTREMGLAGRARRVQS